MKCALLLALAACSQITDDGTPWEDASMGAGTELGPPPTLRAAPGCTLRVASWNLHLLDNPANVLEHFRASTMIANADIILLQETAQYPGEAQTRTATLGTDLAMTWAHTASHELRSGVIQGNAILSRYPLENIAVKRLPHVDQLLSQDRFAIAADVVVGDHRVRVASIHLDVRIQITDRIRQLDPAVTQLDERAIVGGDFNTAPWQWLESLVPLTSTEAIVGMEQAAVLDDYMASRRYVGSIPADTNTFTLPGFGMRLDNLYARAVPILAADIEYVEGSDHWPIWFDIDVCEEL